MLRRLLSISKTCSYIVILISATIHFRMAGESSFSPHHVVGWADTLHGLHTGLDHEVCYGRRGECGGSVTERYLQWTLSISIPQNQQLSTPTQSIFSSFTCGGEVSGPETAACIHNWDSVWEEVRCDGIVACLLAEWCHGDCFQRDIKVGLQNLDIHTTFNLY